MFYWNKNHETPLTKAIINDDVAIFKKFASCKEHVMATNYLGFNAIDLAIYLGKKEYLQILQPLKKRAFKVQLKDEKKVKIVEENEFNALFNIVYTPHLEFENYSFFKKVLTFCPNIYKDDLEDKEVKLYRKYIKEIKSRYFADVSIRWINNTIGFGVFSEKGLKKGDYVGEYTGIMRSTSVFFPKHNVYCLGYPYILGILSKIIIDPEKKGNEMRFTNHNFNPNLEQRASSEHGLFHCMFFANKNIEPNEQLTFNYGQDYWRKRPSPLNI